MKTYTVRPPLRLNKLFKSLTWSIDTSEKAVYLTFDDGPTPEVTEFVLEQLANFDAKATFFCIGNNVSKNPQLFQRIINEGHTIGNHTQDHIDGWRNGYEAYRSSIDQCAELVETNLFRPPYGRIKPNHISKIKADYNIIMWDVLSGDFDENTSPEECVSNVINNVEPGSIVVFHDSIKARERMEYALPLCLEKLSEKGYKFERLQMN